jgi:hypothetical protein
MGTRPFTGKQVTKLFPAHAVGPAQRVWQRTAGGFDMYLVHETVPANGEEQVNGCVRKPGVDCFQAQPRAPVR